MATEMKNHTNPKQTLRALMLALEPRLMYDAAGLVAVMDLSQDMDAHDALLETADGAAVDLPTERQVVFVDSQVEGYEAIVDSASHYADVYLLEGGQDGLDQISSVLSSYSNLDSVHIISHGGPGQLELGDTTIDSQQLAARADQLLGWTDALSSDADILLYGCDVAQGAEGLQFVNLMGQLTGADVAASDDATSSDAASGDMDLEVQSGTIESRTLQGLKLSTVLATNNLPIANNDTMVVQAQEGGATIQTTDVRLNDSDADGDTLYVTEYIGASESDDGILTSKGGLVTFVGEGQFEYTPPAGDFYGTDSFQYKVMDSQGGTSASYATVTIVVANVADLPEADDYDAPSGQEGNSVTISIAGSLEGLLSDADTPYTDGVTQLMGSAPIITGVVVNQPAGGVGTVALNGAGDAFVFTPTAGWSGTTSFDYQIQDGDTGLTTTGTVNIVLTPSNAAAPVMDNSGAPYVDTIAEDNTTSAGTSVSTLLSRLAAVVTDADDNSYYTTEVGIAVTSVDNTNGSWEYSVDAGVTWLDFATDGGVAAAGVADDTSAVLLDSSALIRFVPDADYNTDDMDSSTALVPVDGLTFRAWDQSDNFASGTTAVNVSVNGGTTAYSTAAETAQFSVSAVNDLATITVVEGEASQSYIENDVALPDGDVIADGTVDVALAIDSTIVSAFSDESSDEDTQMQLTITASNGTLQFADSVAGAAIDLSDIDGGGEAVTLVLGANTGHSSKLIIEGAESDINRLFDAANTNYLAWYPAQNFDGTATITFSLSDVVSGSSNYGSGTQPAATAVITATTTGTNDAPSFVSNTTDPAAILEDTADADNAGIKVSALVGSAIYDMDSVAGQAEDGIAITASTQTADATGKWQYRLSDSDAWVDLGVVAEDSATLLSADASVRYLGEADEAGSATLTIKAWDGSAGANGDAAVDTTAGSAYSATTKTVTQSITAVNDASTFSLGGGAFTSDTVVYTEDATVTFDGVDAGLLVIADVDGDYDGDSSDKISVTLRVTKGTLTLGDAAAVAGEVGDGTDTLTVTDTAANITAALDGLVYTPEADLDTDDTLTITVDDGGTTTNGGVKVSSATILLDVTAANDAPTLTEVNAPAAILEDVTSGNNPGFSVASLLTGQFEDVDSQSTGQGIAITGVGGASGEGSWSYKLSSQATTWTDLPADLAVDSALLLSDTAMLRFTPAANETDAGTLNIAAWDQSDGGDAGERADLTVTGGATAFSAVLADGLAQAITAVNDAPAMSYDGEALTASSSLTGREDTDAGAIVLSGDTAPLAVESVDGSAESVTVTFRVATGTLSLDDASKVILTANGYDFNATETELVLTGTIADINDALDEADALIYTPDDGETNPLDDTLTIVVNDGVAESTQTVALLNVRENGAPTLTKNDSTAADVATITVAEETAYRLDGSAAGVPILVVADEDAPELMVTLSTANGGTFALDSADGLTILSGGSGSDSMQLLGSAEDLNNALATLTYTGPTDLVGVAADTITIEVDDQDLTGSLEEGVQDKEAGFALPSESISVTLTNVNDAPVAYSFSTLVDESTADAPTSVTVDLDADPDADTNPIYKQDDLRTLANESEDLLEDTAITDADAGDTHTVYVWDATANAGEGDWSDAAGLSAAGGTVTVDNGTNQITYTPEEGFSGRDTIRYYVVDAGSGESMEKSIQVNVVNTVDDSPEAVDDRVTVTEDTLSAPIDVLANDTGLDGMNINEDYGRLVTITTPPEHGTALANANGTISFVPEANFVGTVTFSYQVQEKNAVGVGTGQPSEATVTVEVMGVNDAPVVAMPLYALTAMEDSAIAVPEVMIADMDDPTESTTRNVKVVVSSSNGMLTLNSAGVNITSGANGSSSSLTLYGTLAKLNDALATLQYQGKAGFFGNDTLTVMVDDLGNSSGEANGSAVLAQRLTASGHVDITVTPVNDEPSAAQDVAKTVVQNTPLTFNPLLDYVDRVEGDSVKVGNFTQPQHGELILNKDGTFTYIPDMDVKGVVDHFTFDVVDSGGAESLTSTTVTLSLVAANQAPDAPEIVKMVDAGGTLSFTVLSGSEGDEFTDYEGDTMFVVAFDNTTTNGGTVKLLHPTQGKLQYTPPAGMTIGEDTFSITVGDVNGGLTETTVRVIVGARSNYEPIAASDHVSMDEDGAPLVIDVLANDYDLDSGTNTGLKIGAFDQTTTNGGKVVLLEDGTLKYTPKANFKGEDTIKYTVTDSLGASSKVGMVTVMVNSVNDDPVAMNDAISTAEDTPALIAALSNDHDFNDTGAYGGEGLAIASVVQPEHGTVSYDSFGRFTYTPDADYNGEDSFVYTVVDSGGKTAMATVTINVAPVGDNPVARDDMVNTVEDTQVTINVLANDYDVENNDTLFVPDFTQGSHGQVVYMSNGVLKYIPQSNWSGTDTFSYTVMDGFGGMSTAMVTVNVAAAPDIPVVGNDALTTAEDVPLRINVASQLFANDKDSDGGKNTLALVSFTNPPASTGTLIDNGDGTLTFTPMGDWHGTTNFAYTVKGSGGLTANGTVTITVTARNDAPTVTLPGANPSGDEDTPITITGISVADVDVAEGNGMMQATLTVGNGTLTMLSTEGLTFISGADGSGSMTIQGTRTNLNSAIGTMTYLGNAHYNGQDTITVTVNDLGNYGSSAQSVSKSFYVNVASVVDAPIVSDVAVNSGVEDISSVVLTDQMFSGGFLNVEGTAGLAQIKITALPSAMAGTLMLGDANVAVGDVVTISQLEAGQLKFKPMANWNGSVAFDWNGTHETGPAPTWSDEAATFTLQVAAANDAPTLSLPNTVTTAEDSPVSITGIAVADVDGGNVTVTVQVENGALTLNPLAGVTVSGSGSDTITVVGTTTNVNTVLAGLRYQGESYYNGADTLTVSVNDGANGGGEALTVNGSVTINITPVANAPAAGADSFSLNEDGSITITQAQMLANDVNIEDPSVSLSITGVFSPANGALVNNNDGSYTYTPAANFNGVDSFSYTIDNGAGGASTGSVILTVNAVNDAPTLDITNVPTLSVNAGATTGIAGLSLNDIDVGETAGGKLLVTISTSATDGQLKVANAPASLLVTGSGSKSLQLTGSLSDVQYAIGSISYTAGQTAGTDTLTVAVSDQGNTGSTVGSTTATLQVTVNEVNQDPVGTGDVVVVPPADGGLDTDNGYTIPDVRSNDTDPNGDSLFVAGFTQPVNGSGEVRYLGNGSFQFIPDSTFSGFDWFTYKLSDGKGGFSDAIIYITDDELNENIPEDAEVLKDYQAELENATPNTMVAQLSQPGDERAAPAESQRAEAQPREELAQSAKQVLMAWANLPSQEAAKPLAVKGESAAVEQSSRKGNLNEQLEMAELVEQPQDAPQNNLLALLGSLDQQIG
ncbi:putative outer membrane adhesin like protein [Magnetococcus marinus MC-1]|uniref:Putative outer membrane adhesin like protein n=1 Tax=Magnetococcus marinus (strain ATCC BAA-1437 / JCM 17883 / MC-1) TaxID=156889 RepID=A0L6S0_MAGMM|nr:tandem-95 repeat protein [Magnetococcus marinus]ABK43663.1 putative outer membrane adhesin like protein [Magnetococcus marinus MC-1]